MAASKDSYFTLKSSTEGIYKEKGSKFLSFACPVVNEDEIKGLLKNLRSRFHDARHHCYAYFLGYDGESHASSDDGEPAHSAGDPILNQLKSRNLTNSLVVVVRYFGGTKLGISGLINAYKMAAQSALDNNQIISVDVTKPFRLKYPYSSTNDVMRLVDSLGISTASQEFGSDCTIDLLVKVAQIDAFKNKVNVLQQTGHKLTLTALD